jgi:hypothetical protein
MTATSSASETAARDVALGDAPPALWDALD